jgi:hypothetical protein
MENILLPDQINPKELSFGAVKALGNGGKSISVSHNNHPFIIQTPEMRCPFGMSRWDKTEKDANGTEKPYYKYDLAIGFDGKETREVLNMFFNKMVDLDSKMIDAGMENSMNWLGKKISSREVTEELYTPMIRYSRDKNTGEINTKYAPTFKVQIPFKDGKFTCEAYGGNNSEVDLSTMNLQGSRVISIIQCVGIWVVGKKYGCSWKVLQMKIMPKSNIPKFAFRQIEGDKVADDEVVTSDDELDHGH